MTASCNELCRLVAPACGALAISENNLSAKAVKSNGTYTLIQTPFRRLIVSACHIWTEFQNIKERARDAALHLCVRDGTPIVLNWEPIDFDTELDLVTFSGERLPFLQYFPISFESAVCEENDPIFSVGYPGHGRRVVGEALVSGRMQYMLKVADKSRFITTCNLRDMKLTKLGRTIAEKTTAKSHGGMSGAPCFRARPGELLFAGIVTEFGADLLRFTQERCIQPDGTLNRSECRIF